jgi:hypothetical protein
MKGDLSRLNLIIFVCFLSSQPAAALLLCKIHPETIIYQQSESTTIHIYLGNRTCDLKPIDRLEEVTFCEELGKV